MGRVVLVGLRFLEHDEIFFEGFLWGCVCAMMGYDAVSSVKWNFCEIHAKIYKVLVKRDV